MKLRQHLMDVDTRINTQEIQRVRQMKSQHGEYANTTEQNHE